VTRRSATALGLAAVALVLGASTSCASSPAPEPPACPAVDPVLVGDIAVPAGPVAGYCQDRLVNAAEIVRAARSLGIGEHTQAIGVMTAMGESSLVNVDHGDAVGPDSRGLFQQRDNGSWGSYEERMDPYTAALHFFERLVALPDWKSLEPTEAAHAVQVNADPDHYTRWWPEAQEVVAALTDATT